MTIKTGEFKDSGSMYRTMRPDERKYWQGMVNHFYGKFITRVSDARKLDPQEVTKLADGRVFHSDEAKSYGLIDAVGTFDVVVKDFKKTSGFSQLKVMHYGKPAAGFGLFQAHFQDPFSWLTKVASDGQTLQTSQLDSQLIGKPLWYSPVTIPQYQH